MKYNNPNDIQIKLPLEPADYPAIICSLPLLTYIAKTHAEIQTSAVLISVLGHKLARFETIFSGNEILAISHAIDLAVSALSGRDNGLLKEIASDPELHSDLSRYFLTLNQMNPLFHRIIAETGMALR